MITQPFHVNSRSNIIIKRPCLDLLGFVTITVCGGSLFPAPPPPFENEKINI